MEQTKNKLEFKAEVKKLLDILVHSLYTSREIFLRELVSNASDALDKIRLKTLKGEEVIDKDLPLEIKITFDKEKKLITISDTGIGMTKEELISNLGTIAKSGTEEFLKQLQESKADASNIIGRFGVGFYSVFMVAKEVKIKTRSFLNESESLEWTSDGLGEYEITNLDEKLSRGTKIEIYLKDDAIEFADKFRLESILKKHSRFISFPIYLENEKVNTTSALWLQPKSSITKEQYIEFYKSISYDENEPLEIIHISIDAPIQFNALLFIPSKNNDIFGFNREHYGLDLYVRRVLIQHKTKELLPEYMSFIEGVVDSEDLPLNISRETLQENAVFLKISQNIKSQVFTALQKKAKDTPEEFSKFWNEFGRVFKMGYMDFSSQEKFLEVLRFDSTFNESKDKLISLEEYVSRKKEKQTEIYYKLGINRDAALSDPHLEIFKKKNVEVLLCYDPIDEFVFASIRKYKEMEIKSADIIDLKTLNEIPDAEKSNDSTEPLSKEDKLKLESLLELMKKYLGDKVKEVRLSSRLYASPVCLISDENALSATMQKMLRLTNKDFPEEKKIIEVNPDNKIIRNLLHIYKKDSSDSFISDATKILFDIALLIDGMLNEPHQLASKNLKLIEDYSELYKKQ